jgi:hypothetical protein
VVDTVIIPRLRRVLAERNLALDELHRRLIARGNAPKVAECPLIAEQLIGVELDHGGKGADLVAASN